MRGSYAVVDGLIRDHLSVRILRQRLPLNLKGRTYIPNQVRHLLGVTRTDDRVKHTTSMTRLQDVQSPPHVALAQSNQTVNGIGLNLDLFLLNDEIDQLPDIGLLERAKSESRASRKQGWRQLVGVIRDDAESGVCCVFLHDPSERHLCHGRHGIRFVQHDELETAQ